jgi:REP element-mobilizing transposase RayT
MTNYFLPLQTGCFYHIYNRGNNSDRIFFQPGNYLYFLQKFDAYLSKYLDVWAYALLPNHFHFLVKTKEAAGVAWPIIKAGQKMLSDYASITSEEFRRFFLCYAKAIKVQESRTGSLFEKNFKRKEIASQQHMLWLVNYIHRNAETHGYTTDFKSYPHSSYRSILTVAPTKLKRNEVLDLFGGREEFIRFHNTNPVIQDVGLLLE